MYNNPITKILGDIESQIVEQEDGVLTYQVKQAVGYDIDKTELIKALQYDRNQYQKGYDDGYRAALQKALECLGDVHPLDYNRMSYKRYLTNLLREV